MKLYFSPFLAGVLFTLTSGFAGCAPARVSTPSGDPANIEKQLFATLSTYYCKQYQWPRSLEQLREQGGQVSADKDFFEQFEDAKFESPRAVLWTMTYVSRDGTPRKVSFIAPPRCGVDPRSKPDKRDVSIAGGGVVFRLPESFSLLKGAMVQQRWKAPPYPDAAWSAPDGRLIAIRFGEHEISDAEVSEALEDVIEAYEAAVPSLVWRSKESRVVAGKNVLRLEFESNSSAGRIINVVYSASFDGRLFAITITGPLENEVGVSAVAESVEGSLVVR
jgi:hypothetical protein